MWIAEVVVVVVVVIAVVVMVDSKQTKQVPEIHLDTMTVFVFPMPIQTKRINDSPMDHKATSIHGCYDPFLINRTNENIYGKKHGCEEIRIIIQWYLVQC